MSDQRNQANRDIDPALAYFEMQWGTYMKVVANNLMSHREVYRELHRVLIEDAPQPFCFIDVACGDASCTVGALKNTSVASYCGIDITRPALNLAAEAVASLDCPTRLENRDFVDALQHWSEPVDVIWIGMSLHHLLTPAKAALMRKVHDLLGDRGLFIVWEPTLLEGEDRGGWLDRFTSNRPFWTALSDKEFASVDAHNRAADYPETAVTWRALGIGAGFSSATELFRAPNDLHRMYLFRR